MKVFIAAIYANNFHTTGKIYTERLTDVERKARDKAIHKLESFHYIKDGKYADIIRQHKDKIFLDSGAFSFFTKGEHIDIDKYISFVYKNKDIILDIDGISLFSVLDDVRSAKNTYENQLYMEQNGLKPLPCFHYGEDISMLKKYIDNYEYITLGGMVPISTKQLYYWLDELWLKYLTKDDGTARIKVHGFGLTTFELMEPYPWFSVDSSTWVQNANFGMITSHKYGTLNISAKSPARKDRGRHFDTLPPLTQLEIKRELEEKGFDYERLAINYPSRWAYNIQVFAEEETRIDNSHLKRQGGLF